MVKYRDMEIYKDVIGYEGLYKVSNYGNIISVARHRRKESKVLKQCLLRTGYYCIDLCNNGVIKKHLVHRLVANAFLDNHLNKEQVNHINGIKNDNKLENLEWCTRSENQLHSIKTGLRSAKGEKNSQSKLNELQVMDIFNRKQTYSIIANEYNISISTVSDIKRGYSWYHITKKVCDKPKK